VLLPANRPVNGPRSTLEPVTSPKPNENQGIATPEEMALAIESSGYLIEARVARALTDGGFLVQQNTFSTNPNDVTKTIETDVTGRRGELVNEENGSTVAASVLVECKNNTQPFAFFVQRQEIPELNENWIKYGGFPSFSLDQKSMIQDPLHKLLAMKDWHHYCQATEVATQFCSFTRVKEKPKWKAEPNENYSKSFSNLAIVAARDWEGMYGLHLQNIQMQMTYPVVVFQGPIYRVQEEHGKAKAEDAQHIQLRHSALLNGDLVTVQIDVVTETELPILIGTIQSELKTFRDRVIDHYDRLLSSALDQKRVASQPRRIVK
jgi:hypothetical protein